MTILLSLLRKQNLKEILINSHSWLIHKLNIITVDFDVIDIPGFLGVSDFPRP